MTTAVVVCLLSSAFLASFLATGLPLVVKKGSAPPVVDENDMVVRPAGHSVARGEVHEIVSKTEPEEPAKPQVLASSSAKAPPAPSSTSSTTKAPPAKENEHPSSNKLPHEEDDGDTTAGGPGGPGNGKVNSGALLRGFYVFMGLGFIVIMYLVARSVRLNQKVTRVHKYGIIANREDMEMAPLEADDDEDDVVFELPNNS